MSLQINRDLEIVGDIPKVLDFRNHDLTTLLEESLHIINNENVEIIYFPNIAPCLYYVVMENLPNLKEVHVSGDVLWLRCVNLPNLNNLDIGGNLKWLLLENLKTIKTIDLTSCHDLDMIFVEGLPSLKQLNIRDLKKLRKVHGDSHSEVKDIDIQRHIHEIQLQSRQKVEIYDDMTFSDIDLVLNTINLGTKAACDQGLIEDCSEPLNFEIRLLQPLEELPRDGTGERYVYELSVLEKESDYMFFQILNEGHHSPESCLVRSLSYLTSLLEVPNNDHPSTDDMLNYLYHLSIRDQ